MISACRVSSTGNEEVQLIGFETLDLKEAKALLDALAW